MTKANKIDIGDQTNKKWILKKHCYINIAHTKKEWFNMSFKHIIRSELLNSDRGNKFLDIFSSKYNL